MDRTCAGAVLGLVALAYLSVPPLSARADQVVEVQLTTGPHAPHRAPDVAVHVPTRALNQRGPLHWAIFLHGFSSCVRALLAQGPTRCSTEGPEIDGYGLARVHERAQTPTLLVVPQLAFVARDSRARRFETAGGLDALIREVQAQLAPLLGGAERPASITLAAHSAGYRAAATALCDSARVTPVRAVVLFDALYAQWDVFAAWFRALPEARLISLYTHSTQRGNRKLAALLRDGPGKLVAGARIERVSTAHRKVPERHLQRVLRALFRSE